MENDHPSDAQQPVRRPPWNKGKLVGAKPPLRPSLSKGDTDRALTDYAEAIRLKPDYTNVYEARSRIYLIRRDYAGTIANSTAQIGLDDVSGGRAVLESKSRR